jgi:hypothetical protein
LLALILKHLYNIYLQIFIVFQKTILFSKGEKMAEFNQEVWGKFINAVQEAMGGGQDNAQLQVLSATIPFDWGIATGNKNPLEYWNFCNQLPKWSNVGQYIPLGGSLVSGYESFLNKIKQDYSQDLKNQITEAQQKLAADSTNLQSSITQASVEYKQYADNQQKLGLPADDFNTWKSTSGASTQIEILQAQVTKDGEVIKSLLAQENRQYADAWAAFNDEKVKKFYTDASNNVMMKRIYEWSANPTDMVQQLRAGTLANAKTLSWSNSSKDYDFSKSWAKGSASIGNFFWSVGGGGAWTQMNTSEVQKSFSASISFKDLSLITVNPESWLNDGYLKTNANGPYVDNNTVGFANEATGNQTYFFGGEKAILPGQVTGILVGYQPKFKITTSSSSFNDVYKSVQGSAGVRVGPFHFGGGGGHTTHITKSTSEENTIEGEDTSNVPHIFGIYLKVLPS